MLYFMSKSSVTHNVGDELRAAQSGEPFAKIPLRKGSDALGTSAPSHC